MSMPAAGDVAPDFDAAVDDGGRLRLSSLRGHIVVLFFYPRDDTPGCTVEACSFQHALPRFGGLDAKIVGVSPDTVRKHARFRAKFGLSYTLVADTDHAVCERYGVWGEKTFFGRKYRGVHRTTFVIGRDGRVAHVFEKVNPLHHASEVAEVVAALG